MAENLATQQADQQAFLNKLDAKLWKSADSLRKQLDAANYKHIVLGLIFLKYVSDSFSAQQDIIKQRYTDSTSDFYLDPTAYSESELADILNAELEERDNYAQDNVFWVPQQARWDEIKVVAGVNIGDKIWGEKTFKGIANLIDDAFDAIEQDNPKLKNVIQRISPYKVDESILLGLIDLFSDTNFTRPTLDGKPISLA
ncbi:MAG: type I restriction-modification system subunit M N-terminal domain-containing protein, partial [[Pasteurella] aerogenes]|nr:type I restriction-modification system subunit M N-terminal domain-containing protein [[Pasteurella] aerogenes]